MTVISGTQEAEAEGSQVQGQPELHSDFENNLKNRKRKFHLGQRILFYTWFFVVCIVGLKHVD
jgi:hypothetical protein